MRSFQFVVIWLKMSIHSFEVSVDNRNSVTVDNVYNSNVHNGVLHQRSETLNNNAPQNELNYDSVYSETLH